MSDRWKPVVGFEGWYEVSEAGRVRSVDRVVNGKRYRSRLLAHHLAKNGYVLVDLYQGGKRTTRTVHSLVAEAFIGPYPDGKEVCHGPGGRRDNRVGNLRYDTRQGNFADKKRDNTEQVGQRHWNCKVSNRQVLRIRRRLAEGESNASVARDLRLSPSLISMIRHGKRRSIA